MLVKFANWFANWLGTVGAFGWCCLIALLDLIALTVAGTALANAHFVLTRHVVTIGAICGTLLVILQAISSVVLQLIALPAIQLQSMQASAQAAEDHAHITEMFRDMQTLIGSVKSIAADTNRHTKVLHDDHMKTYNHPDYMGKRSSAPTDTPTDNTTAPGAVVIHVPDAADLSA